VRTVPFCPPPSNPPSREQDLLKLDLQVEIKPRFLKVAATMVVFTGIAKMVLSLFYRK
jgi:hypothetical protein